MHDALQQVLRTIAAPVIAVSGGVDSMTLAALAALSLPDVLMVHAVSPAVPREATQRVRQAAARRGWSLTVLDAGEFEDPEYRANPADRCWHCKTHLYGSIRAKTPRPILSGANTDDLGEWRPGLEAARRHGVRHPYIEAGVGKRGIRSLARALGLGEIADLPAAPCLSSRVETGIRIEPRTLAFIHRVETAVAARIHPQVVRCRVRASAVVIELDCAALAALATPDAVDLAALVTAQRGCPDLPVRFEAYRNGSAFLRPPDV